MEVRFMFMLDNGQNIVIANMANATADIDEMLSS
jgi:hypothetical protein